MSNLLIHNLLVDSKITADKLGKNLLHWALITYSHWANQYDYAIEDICRQVNDTGEQDCFGMSPFMYATAW